MQSFEVVVVDNGSSDHTQEVLSQFGKRFSAWQVVRESTPGAAAARNCGVEASSGKIVLFLDDDVLADSWLLEEHLKFHHRFTGVAVLGTIRYRWNSQTGKNSPLVQLFVKHPEILQSFDFRDPADVPFLHFYTGNLSLPRSLFANVGGFDESFSFYGFEDIDFGYRLTQLGHRIVHNPRASAVHDHSFVFSELAHKRYHAGLALGYLLEKHPELLPVFFPPSRRYRRYVKVQLGRLCALLRSPLERLSRKPAPRMPGGLYRLYQWSFEYEFSKGFAHYRTKRVSPGSRSAVS
jgi:GT2 family glycosyltransferase